MHQTNDNASQPPFLAAITAGVPSSLSHPIENVFINNTKFSALIDTGSSENSISSKLIAKLKISYQEKSKTVSMATRNLQSKIKGYCLLSMTLQAQTYNDIKFTRLGDLCADIILGQTFMKKHSAIMLSYLPPSNIFSLAVSNVTPPTLFSYLSKDCHSIATKRHKYGHDDKNFKDREIKPLLAEKILNQETPQASTSRYYSH